METRRRALQLALGASASALVAGRAHGLSSLLSMPSQAIRASALADDAPSMQWWEDAKFGLFMHWGLCCRRRMERPAGKRCRTLHAL